eukprot:Gb_16314 [translate_table: standard]
MEKPFTLYIDASGIEIGTVLTQERKVIAYESRKMNDVEKRYPIFDQELLAILHAIKIWKHYLKNNEFEVIQIINHYYLSTKSRIGIKTIQMGYDILEFKPKLTYQAGKENVVANDLSRLPQGFNISVIQGSFRQEI